MKKIFLLITALSFLTLSCKSTKTLEQTFSENKEFQTQEFKEIWAYLMQGEETFCTPTLPLTDIGYFINAVNSYSELDSVPLRSKYFADYNCRIHIVSSVDSKAQTHLLLDPSLPLRKKIIDQLIKATETYDGLQIDWELITSRDKEHFYSFLKELKSRLKNKTLSVAIPARMRKLTTDAYDYQDLSQIVDKIVVMAYDEHWSTSVPGAVASLEWGEKVCDYSITAIPQEKLIMGLPFYGRTWRDDKDGGKAYKFNTMKQLLETNDIKVERDIGNILNFTYEKKLTIEGWFDDSISTMTKASSYKQKGVENIAFWRLGQEDSDIWQHLEIKKPAE